MKMNELLEKALHNEASDVFIIPGAFPSYKASGKISALDANKITPQQAQEWIDEIYAIAKRDDSILKQTGDDDFSFSIPGFGRFRCNAYKQRNTYACVIRVVPFGLPDPKDKEIPQTIIDLAHEKNGMILITGPAGSGKSTTLACMIDAINDQQNAHIITLEDPIEFVHNHKNSLVSQREVSLDTEDYSSALRAALRQTPNVILLGEMRDFETIQTAIRAAETGQLLLSTLHTLGAANTVDRIIDLFPSNQQKQIRTQLSMVLKAVVSQQLIPGLDGKLHPAFEIMIVTPAIQNLIREGKTEQIDNAIALGKQQHMISMDQSIMNLYNAKKISKENALAFAQDRAMMARRLK